MLKVSLQGTYQGLDGLVFDDDEMSTLASALRVAANHYRDSALTCRRSGRPDLSDAYIQQARAAMTLADKIGR